MLSGTWLLRWDKVETVIHNHWGEEGLIFIPWEADPNHEGSFPIRTLDFTNEGASLENNFTKREHGDQTNRIRTSWTLAVAQEVWILSVWSPLAVVPGSRVIAEVLMVYEDRMRDPGLIFTFPSLPTAVAPLPCRRRYKVYYWHELVWFSQLLCKKRSDIIIL